MISRYPVLMYHGIQDSEDDPGRFDPVYSVTTQQFIEHMDWLKENGYTPCLLSQTESLCDTDKPVVITFDDGDVTNYTAAYPLLKERDMIAEFYITTDWINNDFSMSEAQLRELDANGMAVDAHGKTHQYLSDMSDEDMYQELAESKTRLDAILGHPITTVALPGGRGDHRTRRFAVELGYERLCTSELGYNDCRCNPYAIKRIAVTRTMDMPTFISLVSGEGSAMKKMRLRQFILTSMKTVLGNRLYEVVRTRLLG